MLGLGFPSAQRAARKQEMCRGPVPRLCPGGSGSHAAGCAGAGVVVCLLQVWGAGRAMLTPASPYAGPEAGAERTAATA